MLEYAFLLGCTANRYTTCHFSCCTPQVVFPTPSGWYKCQLEWNLGLCVIKTHFLLSVVTTGVSRSTKTETIYDISAKTWKMLNFHFFGGGTRSVQSLCWSWPYLAFCWNMFWNQLWNVIRQISFCKHIFHLFGGCWVVGFGLCKSFYFSFFFRQKQWFGSISLAVGICCVLNLSECSFMCNLTGRCLCGEDGLTPH